MKKILQILTFNLFILVMCTACLSAGKLKRQTQKGITYLLESDFRFDYIYLYAYLKNRYQWPDLPKLKELDSYRDSLAASRDHEAQEFFQAMLRFQRLVDPGYIVSAEVLEGAKGLDKMTLPALYCDTYPVDTATYFPMLRAAAFQEDYRCTHALLALYWLSERKCFNAKELELTKKILIRRNYELIESRNGSWDDPAIEAAAILQAIGEKIPRPYLKAIARMQLPAGGWPNKAESEQPDVHTTILALWVLGEKTTAKPNGK